MASLAGCDARSWLGLRAYRQLDKPPQRLGTLYWPSTYLLVLLDQRFAIDPHLPSLPHLAMLRVTWLEPRTPHQPEKLQKLSKNESVVLSFIFQSTKNSGLHVVAISAKCGWFTGGCSAGGAGQARGRLFSIGLCGFFALSQNTSSKSLQACFVEIAREPCWMPYSMQLLVSSSPASYNSESWQEVLWHVFSPG